MPEIGQTILHYEIVEKISSGGMGVVYKARDLHLDRFVALKTLSPEKIPNPEFKKRFIQEAKAASALNHPNITVIHEIDETEDGQIFIVMAYYEAETLGIKMQHGPLGVDEATGIALQIASGLANAHERGIIHGDITPSNILVTTDGIALIIDFGLARFVGSMDIPDSAPGAGLGSGEGRDPAGEVMCLCREYDVIFRPGWKES